MRIRPPVACRKRVAFGVLGAVYTGIATVFEASTVGPAGSTLAALDARHADLAAATRLPAPLVDFRRHDVGHALGVQIAGLSARAALVRHDAGARKDAKEQATHLPDVALMQVVLE